MYSIEGIKKGLAQPRYILQELDRLYYRRAYEWEHNRDGIDIFEQDWDNLIILDACRADVFENVVDLPGETTTVQSKGSATKEFLQANFDGRSLTDTVYVTASPMLYRHRDEIDVQFCDVFNIWQEEGWDEEYRTVLPKTVIESVLDAAEQYPNKRLLVHFIQPHYPFIGPTGQEHFDLGSLSFQWDDAASGELGISDAILTRAYRENLEETIPSVERLFFQLGGKTVVTADHGQLFGERLFPIPIREYGHPPGLYHRDLVTVPWHVFDDGTRRTIHTDTESETSSRAQENEQLARERLRNLGYVD